MKRFVAKAQDVKDQQVVIREVNGIEIGVFHVDEHWYAVRNVCPHKLAPVCKGTVGGTMLPSEPGHFDFGLHGRILRCPWHGWEFDLVSGQALFGISSKKVKTYPVEVVDDEVYVDF